MELPPDNGIGQRLPDIVSYLKEALPSEGQNTFDPESSYEEHTIGGNTLGPREYLLWLASVAFIKVSLGGAEGPAIGMAPNELANHIVSAGYGQVPLRPE